MPDEESRPRFGSFGRRPDGNSDTTSPPSPFRRGEEREPAKVVQKEPIQFFDLPEINDLPDFATLADFVQQGRQILLQENPSAEGVPNQVIDSWIQPIFETFNPFAAKLHAKEVIFTPKKMGGLGKFSSTLEKPLEGRFSRRGEGLSREFPRTESFRSEPDEASREIRDLKTAEARVQWLINTALPEIPLFPPVFPQIPQELQSTEHLLTYWQVYLQLAALVPREESSSRFEGTSKEQNLFSLLAQHCDTTTTQLSELTIVPASSETEAQISALLAQVATLKRRIVQRQKEVVSLLKILDSTWLGQVAQAVGIKIQKENASVFSRSQVATSPPEMVKELLAGKVDGKPTQEVLQILAEHLPQKIQEIQLPQLPATPDFDFEWVGHSVDEAQWREQAAQNLRLVQEWDDKEWQEWRKKEKPLLEKRLQYIQNWIAKVQQLGLISPEQVLLVARSLKEKIAEVQQRDNTIGETQKRLQEHKFYARQLEQNQDPNRRIVEEALLNYAIQQGLRPSIEAQMQNP